jgi:hypothetical protein
MAGPPPSTVRLARAVAFIPLISRFSTSSAWHCHRVCLSSRRCSPGGHARGTAASSVAQLLRPICFVGALGRTLSVERLRLAARTAEWRGSAAKSTRLVRPSTAN